MAVLVGAQLLSGCASTGGPTENQSKGAVVGALLGAIAGAALSGNRNRGSGLLVGALAGAAIGAGIGTYLDRREKEEMEAASRRAAMAPVGNAVPWTAYSQDNTVNEPKVTASGWITPTDATYVTDDGDHCRDLQRVVNKDGQSHQDNARVCQSSGWALPDV